MTEWLKRDLLDALLAQRTLAKHVRAWWVIDIRRGLSGPLHIGQNGLPKMPTPEVIDGPAWVLEESRIKVSSGNPK